MKCSHEPFTCSCPGTDTPNHSPNSPIYKICFNIIFPRTPLINIRHVLYVWLKTKGTDFLTETLENTENSSEIFSLYGYILNKGWKILTAEVIVLVD
jgi:hypothetical protein